jgi:hypothetical protein
MEWRGMRLVWIRRCNELADNAMCRAYVCVVFSLAHIIPSYIQHSFWSKHKTEPRTKPTARQSIAYSLATCIKGLLSVLYSQCLWSACKHDIDERRLRLRVYWLTGRGNSQNLPAVQTMTLLIATEICENAVDIAELSARCELRF